jgi:dolichyl-phosphate beta-glucosyltransferase
MKITLIIPCFNEELRIEPTLQTSIAFLSKHFEDYEILCIEDGSKDKTAAILQTYKDQKVRVIANPKNMGKGFAVKLGMLNAQFDLMLFMDSDLATPLEEMLKMIPYTKQGYGVVIASRALDNSNIPIKQPGIRQFLGNTFPLLVRTLVIDQIKDTQCGFKIFTKHAARKIFPRQTICRFAFDTEILFIAQQQNIKIKEVPVTWHDKDGSTVNLVKDVPKMFRDIFKIRYNHWKKHYD